MSEHEPLHERITDAGYFGMFLAERDRRLDERFAELQKALQLQAGEYARRLDALNHAHEKAVGVQHTYVTQDKYEDKLKAEATARDVALVRIDERFADHVKRYEARQREVDLLLAAQKGAAEAAEQATSKAASVAKSATEAQGRRTNRNIAAMGLALTAIVAFANFLPSIVPG